MTEIEARDQELMKITERLIAYKTAEGHVDMHLLLFDVASLVASGKLLSLLHEHGCITITRAEYTMFVYKVVSEIYNNMQAFTGMDSSQGQSITIIDEPVPQGVFQ